MPQRTSTLVAFFLLGVASACGGETQELVVDPQDAVLCVSDRDGVRIRVNFGDCQAGGCVSVESEACEVTSSGNVISVAAEAILLDSNESSCPAHCERVMPECDPLALAPGEYEIRYGQRAHRLTVPIVSPRPFPGSSTHFFGTCDGDFAIPPE